MDRFRNVVVGVDIAGREHLVAGRGLDPFSRAALDKAVWIAGRNGARLHLIATLDVDAHAESLIRRDDGSGRRTVLVAARERLDALAAPARDAGIDVTTLVGFGAPARALLDDIKAAGRDLAVVGHRSRGALATRLLGSTAQQLLLHAPVPVWVAHDGPDQTFDVVLAPIDFDDAARDVLVLAETFAADLGARLHVLHAVDHSAEEVLRAGDADEALIAEYHRQRKEHADERFDALLAATLTNPGAAVRHLVEGTPAAALHDAAKRIGADLVVMGTHGRCDLEHQIMGATAERVLPDLDTSLLVVKPTRHDA